ncbi:MAG: hypothetical protein KJO79_03575 [Verrucomicrobiae bacterium]|nr:hypothetical protein [Verrucomicrobiae bacterium]NNJ86237.1 hypothetical protein [Akkermansiaceae bacterium]
MARFEKVASYKKGDTNFNQIKSQIREGDLIAFWMTPKATKKGLLNVRIGALAFLAFQYGHSAIVVKVPGRKPPLRLFSCLPKIGSHYSGGLDELQEKNFIVFRLDQWNKVDAQRLREFANIARKKSNEGFAYDYVAAAGIWSNHLEPLNQDDIQGTYTCSTSVAAALHYAGVDLTKIKNRHAFQIVSPKKVFTSPGRIIGAETATSDSK